jgi:hypothetical protein
VPSNSSTSAPARRCSNRRASTTATVVSPTFTAGPVLALRGPCVISPPRHRTPPRAKQRARSPGSGRRLSSSWLLIRLRTFHCSICPVRILIYPYKTPGSSERYSSRPRPSRVSIPFRSVIRRSGSGRPIPEPMVAAGHGGPAPTRSSSRTRSLSATSRSTATLSRP